MQSLWLLSCFCLVVTACICLAGVLARNFDDNLLQRFGMAVLCIFCFGRARAIWGSQEVNVDWFGVHFGTALFAVGTGLKFFGRWAKAHRERFMERRHATGPRRRVPW